MRQPMKMRQLPEAQTLLEAAVTALVGLLPPQLAVQLEDGPMGARLRLGTQAEFTLLA